MLEPELVKCKDCDSEGLHVCLPIVIGLLKEDKQFRQLVADLVQEHNDKNPILNSSLMSPSEVR